MPVFSHADYARLLDETIQQVKSLSKIKGGEYAGDLDRLANFRRNGVQLGLPMETIWAIYYNKHHDSVMQYISDLNNAVSRVRAEPISGRIDDMITYLILFKAMLQESAAREPVERHFEAPSGCGPKPEDIDFDFAVTPAIPRR